MKRVVIESPYKSANSEEHCRYVLYARRAMLDSLSRGESPMASHLLYTQVLDDDDGPQRLRGIDAGLAWAAKASATVVYVDYGISAGMAIGIAHARTHNREIEHRSIGKNKDDES